MPLTVVLDTSVIIRALIGPTSFSAKILDAFLDGEFRLAVSPSILHEIRETLQKPRIQSYTKLSDQEMDEFILLLRSEAILTTDLFGIQTILDDPEDDKFLGCALEANADYVVSVDEAHLLPLKTFRLLDYRVDLIDPSRFVQILNI